MRERRRREGGEGWVERRQADKERKPKGEWRGGLQEEMDERVICFEEG